MKISNAFLFLITTHCLQAMDQPLNTFNDQEIYDFLPTIIDTTLPNTPKRLVPHAVLTLRPNALHVKRKLFQDESDQIPTAASQAQSSLESESSMESEFMNTSLLLEKEEGSATLPSRHKKKAKEASLTPIQANIFKCQFCDFSTHKSGSLTFHQNRNHKSQVYKELTDPNFKKEVFCPKYPECAQRFMNVQDYLEHVRIFNHTVPSIETAALSSVDDKAPSIESSLIPTEQKSTSQDKPFGAPYIPVIFKKPAEPKVGYSFNFDCKSAATPQKDKFECPVLRCLHKTHEYGDLKKHILSLHTKLRPYACPASKCKRAFALNSNLHSHIKRFHPGLQIPPLSQEVKDSIENALAPFLQTFSCKKWQPYIIGTRGPNEN